MDNYTLGSLVLTLAVLIGYINYRYIKLPSTVAIMASALLISLTVILLQSLGVTNLGLQTKAILHHTNFQNLLLKGMLSFLLFAGALNIDWKLLKSQKWEIGSLASLSTVASALLIGYLTYLLLPWLHVELPLLYCLLFGALISPTDPIAVLSTFKEINAPKKLAVCVAGESLFNDGVGIVLFTTLFQLAFMHNTINLDNVVYLFCRQAVGGIGYGLLLSYLTWQLLKTVDDHKIAILLTLASVSGGYTLALWLDISGPLAMVVLGIYLGNKLRHYNNRPSIAKLVETFWEVLDEVLNAILFFLIGFELLDIHAANQELLACILMIPFVLLVRLITVAMPMKALQLRRVHSPFTISILTWGGLRGGLAVALALALPDNQYRDLILAMTYSVVCFAVIIQGLSIKPLAKLAHEQSLR